MSVKQQHKHSANKKRTIWWPEMGWHLKKYPECKEAFCSHGSWLFDPVYCVTCGRRI